MEGQTSSCADLLRRMKGVLFRMDLESGSKTASGGYMSSGPENWYGDDSKLVLAVMTDAQISSQAEAQKFAEDIRTIHESLRPAVVQFLRDGVVPSSLVVMGWSVERIQ